MGLVDVRERPPAPSNAGGPWFAVMTASNRGAIAVIRVWGEDALTVANAAFRPVRGSMLGSSRVNHPRFGRVGSGIGDEVVAVVLATKGKAVEAEFQCHGGPAAVSLVIEALLEKGASPRSPEDWMSRNAESPIRAVAALDVAEAETERVARHLLAQANGALDEELERILSRIGDDFTGAIASLENLECLAEIGLRFLSSWRVVLAGRPNVGKSRLLNAIAGYSRAIVSPMPGTTRDVLTVRTAIDGWPIELSDTAGLRDSTDPIEARGVSLARTSQKKADVVLLVLDQSEPLTQVDQTLVNLYSDAIMVCNKSDLAPAWEPRSLVPSAVSLSAETGEGLDNLLKAILKRIVPVTPPDLAAIPFRSEQRRGLTRARRLLEGGRSESARRAIRRIRLRGG